MPRHSPSALSNLTFVYKLFSVYIQFIVFFRNLFLVFSCYGSSGLSFWISLFWVFKTFVLNGGDEEIRTPDPLLARQVLSQLSYTPMLMVLFGYLFFKQNPK